MRGVHGAFGSPQYWGKRKVWPTFDASRQTYSGCSQIARREPPFPWLPTSFSTWGAAMFRERAWIKARSGTSERLGPWQRWPEQTPGDGRGFACVCGRYPLQGANARSRRPGSVLPHSHASLRSRRRRSQNTGRSSESKILHHPSASVLHASNEEGPPRRSLAQVASLSTDHL